MTTLPFHLLPLHEDEVALAEDDDDVRGLVVLDASGHRVGEVDDILVDDAERRARLLVVASGGVLGLGAHRHLVPVEAVARVSDHVRLHHTEDAVAPTEELDGVLEGGDCSAVYERYGCTPSWDSPHTSTYFHDRRW